MAATNKDTLLDRAKGALIGGALGDALGMPTQLLTADEIEAKFMDNVHDGGWDTAQATRFLDLSRTIFSAPQLDIVTEFRS